MLPVIINPGSGVSLERQQTVYYVKEGLTHYKVVCTASRYNDFVPRWEVYGSQGIHMYQRQCDETKPTHKRVVAIVMAALAEPVQVAS